MLCAQATMCCHEKTISGNRSGGPSSKRHPRPVQPRSKPTWRNYAMNRTATIVERIASSEIYKDYERAFSEATQLPLALRPVEVWRFALEGKRYENPFCAMLAKCNRACAACLETQKKMDDVPETGARPVTCFPGLSDIAPPLQPGKKSTPFLQTIQ